MFIVFAKGATLTTRIRKKEALLGVVPIGKFVFKALKGVYFRQILDQIFCQSKSINSRGQ